MTTSQLLEDDIHAVEREEGRGMRRESRKQNMYRDGGATFSHKIKKSITVSIMNN